MQSTVTKQIVNPNSGAEIQGTALAAADKPLNYPDDTVEDTGLEDDSSTTTTTTTTTATPGFSTKVAGAANSSGLVGFARQFLGTPYKWGGTGPLGFDCSGFVQYVFKNFGVNLPRVSYQQAAAGTAIGRGGQQVGDLIWFDNSSRNPGADHIAIYIGNGQIIEAPKAGVPLRIRNLGANENYGVTRVLGSSSTSAGVPGMHSGGHQVK